MFVRVCKEDTLMEGGARVVIADAQLVVLTWPENGGVKAFQGVCPHSNIPLADADFDGMTLTCPIHWWSWDMNSGRPTHPHARHRSPDIRRGSKTASSMSTPRE